MIAGTPSGLITTPNLSSVARYGNLTNFFRALLAGEQRGVQVLTRLARSALLTTEERDKAGDVILADEVRHARLVQSLIPNQSALPIAPLCLPDEEIIARQPRVEGFLVRMTPRLYPIMTTEQVDVLKSIIEDEKGHVRWGIAVRDRLGLRTVRALHWSPAVQLAQKALHEPVPDH